MVMFILYYLYSNINHSDLLQKSLSPGIPFITSHVYHLQSAFKFNNLYFMTIQHIEKLVIRENYF